MDKTASVEDLTQGVTVRATGLLTDPGGKSVHAAVVTEQLFGAARLVTAFGGANGRRAEELLGTYTGLATTTTRIGSETRETWTVVSGTSGAILEVTAPAPNVSTAELADLWLAIERSMPATVLVGGGSLPLGVGDDFYARLTELGRNSGALVLVDATGETLKQALSAGPYLVKPNLNEASALLGIDLEDSPPQGALNAALAIREMGAENVWLTLGSIGSILATDDGQGRSFGAVPANVVNTVGCGDAMMGAAAGALASGSDLISAVAIGVAAAASQAETLSPIGVDVATVRKARGNVLVEVM
ncbi:MAG: PfkB family carbohydrate kinase [Actinomycetia bacterium]|nr:PfkB family carbohydrate kinase [Actinomycetes bacterium]